MTTKKFITISIYSLFTAMKYYRVLIGSFCDKRTRSREGGIAVGSILVGGHFGD